MSCSVLGSWDATALMLALQHLSRISVVLLVSDDRLPLFAHIGLAYRNELVGGVFTRQTFNSSQVAFHPCD